MDDPYLMLQDISKDYGSGPVLKAIDLDVYPGEVLALVGENGAGKSTLIKIIAGSVQATEGTIRIGNSDVPISSTTPSRMKQLGIGVIYQELSLVETMTTIQNFAVDEMLRSSLRYIRWQEVRTKALNALGIVGGKMDANVPISSMQMAERQLVEIAKAIANAPRLLVMDEPTSSLTAGEVDHLFEFIRRFKAEGHSIIYISHRMNEVTQIADRIGVLRDGQLVSTRLTNEWSSDAMLKAMIGKDLFSQSRTVRTSSRESTFEVKNLTGSGVRHVSLAASPGTITGIWGLIGSGTSELAKTLIGALPCTGTIIIRGKTMHRWNPAKALNNGVMLIPEDRKSEALILYGTALQNFSLPFMHGGKFPRLAIKDSYHSTMPLVGWNTKRYPSNFLTGSLSGGNQQKIVFARALASRAKVLVLSDPTRGIDVGAKQDIYDLLETVVESGTAVILISSEIDEILRMADYIGVMHEGHLQYLEPNEGQTPEQLLHIAIGGR